MWHLFMIPEQTKFSIQVTCDLYESYSMTAFDLCSVKLDSTPTSIEFSPNSERIAIGTIRGKVIVYDMVGKKMTIQRQVQGSTDSVRIVTTFRPWFISVRPESPLKGSHKCSFMRYI